MKQKFLETGKKILKDFVNTVKQNKIRIIIVTSSVVVLCILAYILTPVIPIKNKTIVSLNTPVKIVKDTTIKLKLKNVTVFIKNFTNDDCPVAGTCFAGKDSVEYEMSIDNHKYATGSVVRAVDTKYSVETVETDYKTYAIIKIVESK